MEQTSSALPHRSPGPELRLLDRRALVGFPALSVAPGLAITDFALQIPNVTFPFSVTGGALRYQRQRLDFAFLDLTIDTEWIGRKFAGAVGKLTELQDIQLSFRSGYLEGHGRISAGPKTPFTFKIGFDAEGERLALILYEVRLYAFSPLPAPQIPVLLSRFADELQLLPSARRRGATGLSADVLPDLVRLAAVSRGYRMPSLDQARLSSVESSSQGLCLRFTSGGLPPAPPADEDLMLTLEGSRAFFDAEELIARGRFAEARELYLRHGDAHEAHPFAAERLLGLLVSDPRAHELVIDIAASLARRRERSAVALWTEAVARESRGESARAAERYLALCALARQAGEQTSAFLAAEAAARAAADHAPQLAVRALHELLGVRPDHLPSLKSLARASDLAGDRGGAIRAYRRIAALARDPIDSAQAHVHLARLSSETEDDLAGARLHCEASLRLAPDYPDALEMLAKLCFQSGEHLRAIKSADRLRGVALARHELDRVGRTDLFAGKVWELGLKQFDNALLRYREAASILPAEPEPAYLRARVAERVGRSQEALAAYQQAVELAGPNPQQPGAREAAHQSHRALAQMNVRLGNPARAREHLQAALALDPRDKEALEELIPFYRASGRAAELADACEKAAAIEENLQRRAALLAEAGELHRSRLGDQTKAELLLSGALELESKNRAALEGLLALAESRRDGAQMARSLKALAEIAADPKERVRHLRRLAVVARDLTFDSELSTFALAEILRLEPDDLPTLAELCTVQRRRGDMDGLALALEQRARSAEQQGDTRTVALVLRELAQVLEARLGRLGEAFFAIEKAARLSPEPEVLLELAELSMRCGRADPARRAYEAALSALPKLTPPQRLAEIHAKLGEACDSLGDREGARLAFAQALPFRLLDDQLAARLEELSLNVGQAEALATVWFARAGALLKAQRGSEAAVLFAKSAEALLKSGDLTGAASRFQAALEADPAGPSAAEILQKMSRLHLDRGEPREAARLVARQAALSGDPRSKAKLLFEAAKLIPATPEEEALLAQSIAEDGQFAPPRVRFVELLTETQPEEALSHLEAALAVPLSDADAPTAETRIDLTRQAAFVALRVGLPQAARRYLEQCARHWPEDLEVQAQLAALYRQLGVQEQLLELLASLWPRLSGQQRAEACRETAELALQLGRPEAAAALRGLLETKPGDVWASKELIGLLPQSGGSDATERELQLILSTLIDATSGPERSGFLWQRAGSFRRMGELESARGDLAAAAKESAQPAAILDELAELSRQLRDEPTELNAWAEAIRHRSPQAEKAVQRLLALSRSRLQGQDLENARRGFSSAAEFTSSDLERCEAFLGLAEVHHALGDSAMAARALEEAGRQGPVDKRIDAHLRRGALLENQADFASAADSYEAVLALTARHPAASDGLVRAFRALEDWSSLAEVLAARAGQSPKEQAPTLYAELGMLYLHRLSQKGPAEAALRQAVRLDPSNVEARQNLVALLIERGEMSQAIDLLEEGSEAMPAEPGARLLRHGMELAVKASESHLALRLGRRAYGLGLNDSSFLRELSDLLYLHGALTEALPLQRRLADDADFAERPEEAEEALLRLADLAEQLRDGSLAEQTLRRLLQERPLSLPAAERLGNLLRTERPRESLEILRNYAGQLAPSERKTELLVSLAHRAREELADFDLAAQLFRAATEEVEDALPIRRQLIELYRAAGRSADLIQELRAVAGLSERAGDVDGAVQTLAEEAALCEQTGRVDDALATLDHLSASCERVGRREQAGFYQRRRAELFRDLKLDLEAAETALLRSFELFGELAAAEEGQALSVRRNDPRAEAQWIEKSLELRSGSTRNAALVRLGELLAGPLAEPDRAEGLLRSALDSDPQSVAAQRLLEQLFKDSGRLEELAFFYQQLAQRAGDRLARVSRWREAAATYLDPLQNSSGAAVCLLAAHAEAPDSLEITAQAADLLHQLGRTEDAAELDAEILTKDPLNQAIVTRHLRFLKDRADHGRIAALRMQRADLLPPDQAAVELLEAAAEHLTNGAQERAAACEAKAFELSPANDEAFAAVRARVGSDARRLAEVLGQRVTAVPEGAHSLLRERAQALVAAGELLPGASAYDDLLARFPDDLEALVARAELAAQSGGALAAQPFDRKFVSASDGKASAEVRAKAYLRLGQAAISSRALKDAAEALEAVLDLDDAQGARGREALGLLADVYAQSSNLEGLYRVTLQQAAQSRPEEADVLYRRAAEMLSNPAAAIDALMPLVAAHPTDLALVERAAAGLSSLGRHPELVALYERSAQLIGGTNAAEMLEKAAALAGEELRDEIRARDLREKAARTYARSGQWAKSALLLESAAELGSPEGRAALLVDAVDGWVSAGESEKARPILERLARDFPEHLGAGELSRRLVHVGAYRLALERTFEPLLAAGEFERALALADQVGDAAAIRRALAKLVENGASEHYALRLAELLDDVDAEEALPSLGEQCEQLGYRSAAIEIYSRLCRRQSAPAAKLKMLEKLFALGAGELAMNEAIEALGEDTPGDLRAAILSKSHQLGGDWRARALERMVSIDSQANPKTKASRYVELGNLYRELGQLSRARAAFEEALAQDPECVPAVKRLMGIEPTPAYAERLVKLAEAGLGSEELTRDADRELLADAYALVGQKAKAYQLACQLEPTEHRLRRRAGLATELGLFGESLQLQEQITKDPAELEKILLGYLQASLLPFAIRLGRRLLDLDSLSVQARRWMAERLSPSPEGAAIAKELWPQLLKTDLLDQDAWTLFAEALRRCDRALLAQVADGFGAALSSSTAPSPSGPVRPIQPSPSLGNWPSRPEGLLPVTGVSNTSQPCRPAACASSATHAVDSVLASTSTAPRDTPASAPWSPRADSSAASPWSGSSK